MDDIKTNPILDKKLDSYGSNTNDFVAPSELTVTITLREYRDLVSVKANTEKQVSEARNQLWAAQAENEDLKKKLSALTDLIPAKRNDENAADE